MCLVYYVTGFLFLPFRESLQTSLGLSLAKKGTPSPSCSHACSTRRKATSSSTTTTSRLRRGSAAAGIVRVQRMCGCLCVGLCMRVRANIGLRIQILQPHVTSPHCVGFGGSGGAIGEHVNMDAYNTHALPASMPNYYPSHISISTPASYPKHYALPSLVPIVGRVEHVCKNFVLHEVLSLAHPQESARLLLMNVGDMKL